MIPAPGRFISRDINQSQNIWKHMTQGCTFFVCYDNINREFLHRDRRRYLDVVGGLVLESRQIKEGQQFLLQYLINAYIKHCCYDTDPVRHIIF